MTILTISTNYIGSISPQGSYDEIRFDVGCTTFNPSDLSNWTNSYKVTCTNNSTLTGLSSFASSSGLTQVDVSNSTTITYIDGSAFYNCSNLTSILLPSSLVNINAGAFNAGAFNGCQNLLNIIIPKNVIVIGDNAFNACTGLTNVVFENNSNLQTISVNAFSNCQSLLNITIPISVTTIGDNAFFQCFNLNTVTIQNANINFGNNPIFYGCRSLILINFCGRNPGSPVFPAGVQVKCNAPCFKEDTKILCLNDDNDEVYMPIQSIRPGTLIKTSNRQYIPVNMIGTFQLYNSGDNFRSKNRLYKYSKSKNSTLFEDLIITGAHEILVDELTQKQQMMLKHYYSYKNLAELNKKFGKNTKYKLMTFLDENANPYNKNGTFNIWNLALDSISEDEVYGIYTNGMLVTSCSIRDMNEHTKMKLMY